MEIPSRRSRWRVAPQRATQLAFDVRRPPPPRPDPRDVPVRPRQHRVRARRARPRAVAVDRRDGGWRRRNPRRTRSRRSRRSAAAVASASVPMSARRERAPAGHAAATRCHATSAASSSCMPATTRAAVAASPRAGFGASPALLERLRLAPRLLRERPRTAAARSSVQRGRLRAFSRLRHVYEAQARVQAGARRVDLPAR